MLIIVFLNVCLYLDCWICHLESLTSFPLRYLLTGTCLQQKILNMIVFRKQSYFLIDLKIPARLEKKSSKINQPFEDKKNTFGFMTWDIVSKNFSKETENQHGKSKLANKLEYGYIYAMLILKKGVVVSRETKFKVEREKTIVTGKSDTRQTTVYKNTT